MIAEFMDFLAKYNVVGMAVGLLIAGKVGTLVKGLIEDLVTPLIFSPLLAKLKVNKLEELSWRGVLYGKVLANVIDFLITAVIVSLVIRELGVEVK
jgi:large conductance mechanosensitive channel protein